ncbi:MAG: hypothetical protein R8M45_04425 [Ghiorsea sp.]
MKPTTDYIKENPLKLVFAVIAILGTMITSVWAADERFNQNSEVVQLHHDLDRQKLELFTELKNARRQSLEDKLFVLQLKSQMGIGSPIDNALILRYQNRLNQK